MRHFISLSFFILISVCIAITIGFSFTSSLSPISEDDEQEGLSEQIIINFSHVVAENTPKGLAAQRFADLVRDKTEGHVKVEVFPNGMLFSDGEEIDALRRGDVEMVAPAFSKLTSLVPQWQVLDLPFLFRTDKDVERAFTGEMGKILLELLDEHDIKGLTLWNNGFKQMTSNRGPLIMPEDFVGQRFRIMPSNVLREQFEMMGAIPNRIGFNQVYQNLETNFLDGQENTISNIYSKRFYQVQNYMTISNHGYLGYGVLINKKFWDDIPKEYQEDILEASNETSDWLFEQSVLMNNQQLVRIRQQSNIQIYELSEQEHEQWRKYFEPLYKKFEGDIGNELMDEVKKNQSKSYSRGS
ncbi:TRAP transporter substrate-binding protein [Bacillus solimangrovi]|uniref:TRAP transporter substrate-binding protein n=1 Tax=Bacillus solimangrovi TaxID=1305675 RepID=UPI0009F57802|nr:TRAP transporter substrate-binding protein [Bacillus solimangrovi]